MPLSGPSQHLAQLVRRELLDELIEADLDLRRRAARRHGVRVDLGHSHYGTKPAGGPGVNWLAPESTIIRHRSYAGFGDDSSRARRVDRGSDYRRLQRDEQITGLFTMLDEHLTVPFDTELLGITVTVKKIDLTLEHEIVAICRRDGHEQAVPILHLPLPVPRPHGAEWIDALRHWGR